MNESFVCDSNALASPFWAYSRAIMYVCKIVFIAPLRSQRNVIQLQILSLTELSKNIMFFLLDC